jgi:hypothetical protein
LREGKIITVILNFIDKLLLVSREDKANTIYPVKLIITLLENVNCAEYLQFILSKLWVELQALIPVVKDYKKVLIAVF